MENKVSKIKKENLQWVIEQPIDVQMSLLDHHLDLCKLLINYILEQNVFSFTGDRYRNDPGRRYWRWGYNPGSVRLGDQRLPISVPRVYDKELDKNVSLDYYEKLRDLPGHDDQMVRSVLYGLSTRDYGKVAERFFDSFGLSASQVSRSFMEYSKEMLEAFERRKYDEHEFVAILIDGKYLAKQQMIIALGITLKGEKLPLGVIQSTTENAEAIKGLLKDLLGRGLKYDKGLLFVIDGSKGIRRAIKDVFGPKSVVQRCQWHKRENVVSYLTLEHQEIYRRKLQQAYGEDDYETAKSKLLTIEEELKEINRQAAHSLMEGLEETLTVHRLKLHNLFGRSFTTTNCIESVNSLLEKYIRKVKRWMNSDQRYRWVICGLMELETKLRKVNNYQHLDKLQKAIHNEVKRMEAEEKLEGPDKFSTKNET